MSVRASNQLAFDDPGNRKLSLQSSRDLAGRRPDQAERMATHDIAPVFEGAPDESRISLREHGTTTELVARGEWDLAEQPGVREAIQAALQRSPACVVLDLSQLSFIDSSGIHVVLELHGRCVKQNIHLVIIPAPRAVLRPFEICGLIERLPFLRTPG